jgi:hypothetical protein
MASEIDIGEHIADDYELAFILTRQYASLRSIYTQALILRGFLMLVCGQCMQNSRIRIALGCRGLIDD